jgi:hypothetical protein
VRLVLELKDHKPEDTMTHTPHKHTDTCEKAARVYEQHVKYNLKAVNCCFTQTNAHANMNENAEDKRHWPQIKCTHEWKHLHKHPHASSQDKMQPHTLAYSIPFHSAEF